MATTNESFEQWLTQADVAAERLTVEQTAVLQAAFRLQEVI